MPVAAPPDTRRCVRVPYFGKVTIVDPPNEAPIEARSIDISLNGVGLVSPKPLPVNTLVTLQFHLTNPNGTPTAEQVSGRVAYVRFESGTSVVGLEFLPVLDRLSPPVLVRAIERL
jgi:c-di-GMP-binding flagellar brake protein YcgR